MFVSSCIMCSLMRGISLCMLSYASINMYAIYNVSLACCMYVHAYIHTYMLFPQLLHVCACIHTYIDAVSSACCVCLICMLLAGARAAVHACALRGSPASTATSRPAAWSATQTPTARLVTCAMAARACALLLKARAAPCRHATWTPRAPGTEGQFTQERERHKQYSQTVGCVLKSSDMLRDSGGARRYSEDFSVSIRNCKRHRMSHVVQAHPVVRCDPITITVTRSWSWSRSHDHTVTVNLFKCPGIQRPNNLPAFATTFRASFTPSRALGVYYPSDHGPLTWKQMQKQILVCVCVCIYTYMGSQDRYLLT
jgi:hypothetical protein